MQLLQAAFCVGDILDCGTSQSEAAFFCPENRRSFVALSAGLLDNRRLNTHGAEVLPEGLLSTC